MPWFFLFGLLTWTLHTSTETPGLRRIPYCYRVSSWEAHSAPTTVDITGKSVARPVGCSLIFIRIDGVQTIRCVWARLWGPWRGFTLSKRLVALLRWLTNCTPCQAPLLLISVSGSKPRDGILTPINTVEYARIPFCIFSIVQVMALILVRD